jgi:nucleoside-diphosphate-sugar epimerase
MILAAETPDVLGEVFILADEKPVTINDLSVCVAEVLGKQFTPRHLPYPPLKVAAKLVQKVCQPLGIEPPLYPRRLDFFVKNREFDISKARTRLGYHPQVDLRTGLTRVADWYRQNKVI